jgi:ubiquinone/menaquinone biosynthesis C-methylase UbiE
MQGDARGTGLPPASFDLIHARLVLICIPDPELAVAEMARPVRPGGWVAVQEADVPAVICHPPSPALEQLGQVFRASSEEDGADPNIGRRLHELLRTTGLEDIHVEARADVHRSGDSRRSVIVDLVRSLRPKIVARGLMSELELERLDGEARAHLDDPETLVVPHLLFLAWGRRPAG